MAERYTLAELEDKIDELAGHGPVVEALLIIARLLVILVLK